MDQPTFDEAVDVYHLYCRSRGLSRRALGTYFAALAKLRVTLAVSDNYSQLPTRNELRTHGEAS